MMLDHTRVQCISAIVAGLLTHLSVQFYEPSALQAVCWGMLANVCVSYTLWKNQPQSLVSHVNSLLLLDVVYMITLFSSILVYRIFFHKLRSFPGPFWARATKLWTCKIHLRGEYHRETARLHHKYGDIVRVAPNELDINDVEAIALIYGSKSKFIKGPWYDGPSGVGETRGIQSDKNHTTHRWKRGIWAQANSVAAINEFQPLLLQHIDLFLQKMSASKQIDIGQWFTFLSFDVMGDLAFGHSFDMLKTGESHHFMVILHNFMNSLNLLSAIPWLTTLVNILPASSDSKKFDQFSKDCFTKRRAQGPSRKDIFYYLLGEDKETGSRLSELELVLDSRTAIIGGSDTTSIALGCLFYYLILNQEKYKKLQAEVLANPEPMQNESLGRLPYLNAAIQEALRLMPPVPQGLQRVVGPEGMEVAGKHIPGGTLVSVSPWTVQRDARNFGQPESFIPERWMGEGPEPCNKDAWIPFSIGNYGCIGKQLALSELRHVTAAVVSKYDLEFASDFDVEGFEFSVKNDFTMTPPSVKIELSPRA